MRQSMARLCSVLALALCVSTGAAWGAGACDITTGGGTALQNASANLTAGNWCEFGGTGLNWSLIVNDGSGTTCRNYNAAENHLEYQASAYYDSIRNEIRWMGGPHTGCPPHYIYREDTHTWTRNNAMPCATEDCMRGHVYDQNAMDIVRGESYVRRPANRDVYKYDGSSWSSIQSLPDECYGVFEWALAMEYNEARDGLVLLSDGDGICFWDRATNVWARDLPSFNPPGSNHFQMEYNRQAELMWVIDGNGESGPAAHWKSDVSGTWTALATPQFYPYCCGSGGSIVQYDHTSGKFLVIKSATTFGSDNGDWWEYDIATDSWTDITDPGVPMQDGDIGDIESMSAGIDAYGTIMFLVAKGTGNAPVAYLYKHAALLITASSPVGAQPHDTGFRTMSVTTNSAATCKWDRVSGTQYAAMEDEFYSTGGTTHDQVVATVNGQTYNYYVRCNDGTSTSLQETISWSVTGADPTPTLPIGDCAGEDFTGRTDIVYCDGLETATFYSGQGWLDSGGDPYNEYTPNASDWDDVATVTSGCVSGGCISVTASGGNWSPLSVAWPFREAEIEPDEMYVRYYIKLDSSFSPIYTQAQGGKMPFGFADIRTGTNNPQSSQCGNGSYAGDGTDCWSARMDFRDCLGSGNAFICQANATTRFGTYWYYGSKWCSDGSVCSTDADCSAGTCDLYSRNFGNTFWDNEPWGQIYTSGDCNTDIANMGDCGTGNVEPGLLNDQWYRIEQYIKMNTVGVANGEYRGWIDGVLAYEKTNMVWRIEGHDNLHVRVLWANHHFGGENGTEISGKIYLDQLVAATDAQIGAVAVSGFCGDGTQDIGEECDDGVALNGTIDSCCTAPVGGVGGCTFQVVTTACADDGNVCTTDECTGSSSVCDHSPIPACAVCGNETIESGEQCEKVGGVFNECCGGDCLFIGTVTAPFPACTSDSNICTDDVCVGGPTGSDLCQNIPNTDPCPDGLFCTENETCSGGTCVTQPLDCADAIDCTIDACTEVAGGSCTHTGSDLLCDDGLYCTGTETCSVSLGCQTGDTVTCDDGNVCTDDACSEALGSCTFLWDPGNGPTCVGIQGSGTFSVGIAMSMLNGEIPIEPGYFSDPREVYDTPGMLVLCAPDLECR